MLHVGKVVSGSSTSLLSSSLEIFSFKKAGICNYALLIPKEKKKGGAKEFTVINLMISSQGKSKFLDIHNKLSSQQQQKLQVLHTELNSLAL